VSVGTTFHIYFPAHTGPIPTMAAQNEASFPIKGRILVMDEEEMIRNIVSQMLNRLHYDVAISTNGDELVDQYRKAEESGHPFDAVILGASVCGNMVDNVSLKKLKEIDPEVKVIISGDYADNPMISNAADYGFIGSLVKPYRMEELSRILHGASKKTRKTIPTR
jgi:DNA-binding NtrC family response regulator